jgi:hypothetical protein
LSFFDELKRRKVFRVGIAYVVGAWLIAQVAALVAGSFLAPVWVMQMIITLLVVGLPISLIFAWEVLHYGNDSPERVELFGRAK